MINDKYYKSTNTGELLIQFIKFAIKRLISQKVW